jgi:hypothetical protein
MEAKDLEASLADHGPVGLLERRELLLDFSAALRSFSIACTVGEAIGSGGSGTTFFARTSETGSGRGVRALRQWLFPSIVMSRLFKAAESEPILIGVTKTGAASGFVDRSSCLSVRRERSVAVALFLCDA